MNAFLAVARAAAQAGAAQLAQRPNSLTPLGLEELGAETKSSGSDWVTDFDRRAEEAIRFVLHSYRPHDEIYGEEYGATQVEHPTGYRWSIDPLDGTTNLIRGLPRYCSSVAVHYQDQWLAAAIAAPASRRPWCARASERPLTPADGALDGAPPTRPADPGELYGPLLGRSGRLIASGFSDDPSRRRFHYEHLQLILVAGGFADVRRA